MKRIKFKRSLRNKSKQTKRRIKLLKDKAIENFLLQHLTPVKLDFSKIQDCLLNKLSKDENAIEKIFPENSDSKGESNSQSVNGLSNFVCEINLEQKW